MPRRSSADNRCETHEPSEPPLNRQCATSQRFGDAATAKYPSRTFGLEPFPGQSKALAHEGCALPASERWAVPQYEWLLRGRLRLQRPRFILAKTQPHTWCSSVLKIGANFRCRPQAADRQRPLSGVWIPTSYFSDGDNGCPVAASIHCWCPWS